MSSKGQIVIPKDVRDALGLRPGAKVNFRRIGNQVLLEAADRASPTISYDEFKRCVPPYRGRPKSVEEMHRGIARAFADWKV